MVLCFYNGYKVFGWRRGKIRHIWSILCVSFASCLAGDEQMIWGGLPSNTFLPLRFNPQSRGISVLISVLAYTHSPHTPPVLTNFIRSNKEKFHTHKNQLDSHVISRLNHLWKLYQNNLSTYFPPWLDLIPSITNHRLYIKRVAMIKDIWADFWAETAQFVPFKGNKYNIQSRLSTPAPLLTNSCRRQWWREIENLPYVYPCYLSGLCEMETKKKQSAFREIWWHMGPSVLQGIVKRHVH